MNKQASAYKGLTPFIYWDPLYKGLTTFIYWDSVYKGLTTFIYWSEVVCLFHEYKASAEGVNQSAFSIVCVLVTEGESPINTSLWTPSCLVENNTLYTNECSCNVLLVVYEPLNTGEIYSFCKNKSFILYAEWYMRSNMWLLSHKNM